VTRRGQHLRPPGRALRLEGEDVQAPDRRGVLHVLHNDAEAVGPTSVDVVDRFHRILTAALDVRALRHHTAGALLNEIQIVVVARRAERVVPGQKNDDLAILRQRDQIVRLRSQVERIAGVCRLLKQVQMAARRDAADRRALDA